MKFLKSISLFCIILIFVLGLIYFKVVQRSPSENIGHSDEIIAETAENQGKQDLTVSTKQNVTTCDTIYEVETYIGDSFTLSVEDIPFSFLGLNREELLAEIERYELSPSFQDKQKGLHSIELLQFHPDKITVKKIYGEYPEKIIYYIKAVDHELIVYRSDMEEPYMPTDLTLDMLPENVQQEIIAIKCFNDIKDVYSFLESYTS